MGKIGGFLEYLREISVDRPVQERLKDWDDVHTMIPEEKLKIQAARCMDCGIPFCHKGCPLGNIIPEWNDLVSKGKWKEAYMRLEKTNPIPETETNQIQETTIEKGNETIEELNNQTIETNISAEQNLSNEKNISLLVQEKIKTMQYIRRQYLPSLMKY